MYIALIKYFLGAAKETAQSRQKSPFSTSESVLCTWHLANCLYIYGYHICDASTYIHRCRPPAHTLSFPALYRRGTLDLEGHPCWASTFAYLDLPPPESRPFNPRPATYQVTCILSFVSIPSLFFCCVFFSHSSACLDISVPRFPPPILQRHCLSSR